jgi:TPR repeat protein
MSVPIYDYAVANEELANKATEVYYEWSICRGCAYSFCESGNYKNCPYCKAERIGKTDDEKVDELKKRVEANDAVSMYVFGNYHFHGQLGLLQDQNKAMELWTQAAALGSSKAHYNLALIYKRGGDFKEAKFHLEAAAMAGHEAARCNLGTSEAQSGNMERALKHMTIAASAGHYDAMDNLLIAFKQGLVSRNAMDSTLSAYNNSCIEMRSDARHAFIQLSINSIGSS